MKLTIEQAKKRLEQINGIKDPLSAAFVGGRVGFRKDTKKQNSYIDRTLKIACESVKLRQFIDNEETKQQIKDNPRPSPYCSLVEEIKLNEFYEDCTYGMVQIIRKNKNTVTIKTTSGYTETRKPTFIFKKNS